MYLYDLTPYLLSTLTSLFQLGPGHTIYMLLVLYIVPCIDGSRYFILFHRRRSNDSCVRSNDSCVRSVDSCARSEGSCVRGTEPFLSSVAHAYSTHCTQQVTCTGVSANARPVTRWE